MKEPYYHVAVDAQSDNIFSGKFVHTERVKSTLGIQLRFGKERVGVMFINFRKHHSFTDDELKDAVQFGDQAAVAIHNARKFGEVEKSVAARTALAWTGMLGSTWRHAIEAHAITIREQVKLLQEDLITLPKSEAIDKRLLMIERQANKILERPLTPPLSAEESAFSVAINQFITDRIGLLRDHDLSVVFTTDFSLEASATTRISLEWLRRAFDILIDNAVEAMKDLPKKKIIVSTRSKDHQAEILIRDNGRGVPREEKEKLFKEPIPKPKGEKGHGLGLLLAQMIVQTYGGEIRLGETGPSGTTMIISLPLE